MRKLKLLLLFTAVLIFSSTAFAETLNLNGQTIPPPITVTKTSDLSLNVARTPGVTTYTDAGAGWTLTTPAAFTVVADSGVAVNLTIPATVNLTKGSDTATLNIACRADQASSPASKTAGVDCGVSQTTSSTGALYLAIFPTSVTFDVDAPGIYTGTMTISVNY